MKKIHSQTVGLAVLFFLATCQKPRTADPQPITEEMGITTVILSIQISVTAAGVNIPFLKTNIKTHKIMA